MPVIQVPFENCKHTPADMIMPANTFYTCFACAENPKPYTLTTEIVRAEALSDSPSSIRPADFDRWLFEMQEDAWDRGYQAGVVDFAAEGTNNPYQQAERLAAFGKATSEDYTQGETE